MSIKGLYESEVGDKMARDTLNKSRYVAPVEKDKKPTRKCECGNDIMIPEKTRNGKYVCSVCVKIIPKGKGGTPASNKCSLCGNIGPRRLFKVINHKMVCKNCPTV